MQLIDSGLRASCGDANEHFIVAHSVLLRMSSESNWEYAELHDLFVIATLINDHCSARAAIDALVFPTIHLHAMRSLLSELLDVLRHRNLLDPRILGPQERVFPRIIVGNSDLRSFLLRSSQSNATFNEEASIYWSFRFLHVFVWLASCVMVRKGQNSIE